MHYKIYGDGNSVVVLLHGWGAGGETIKILCSAFPGWKKIVPDMYGFGNTPHPEFPLSLDDYVDAIVQTLENLGVKKAVFLGHSFGGRVAIKLAGFHPNLVQGLVLINSAGVRLRKSAKVKRAERKYARAKRRGLCLNGYGSADYLALDGPMKKTFVNVVNEDLTKHLKRISCPALIITGGRDADTPPRTARIMAKRIKTSRLIEIENAGHYSYLDAFNVVRRTIAVWQEEELCQSQEQ